MLIVCREFYEDCRWDEVRMSLCNSSLTHTHAHLNLFIFVSPPSSTQFANMLLLVRMKEFLEGLLAYRRGRTTKNYRYIPLKTYEKILEQIHLDSAGMVVDPFVSLEDRVDREERQRRWIESLNRDEQDSRSLVNINGGGLFKSMEGL